MIQSALDLLLPSPCLHCGSDRTQEGRLLCAPCSNQIFWCSPENRCRSCFIEDEPLQCGVCIECRKRSAPIHGVGAAVDYMGPAAALHYALLAKPNRRIMKVAASMIIAQLVRFNWPLPDRVIAICRPPIRRLVTGEGPAPPLAREVANQLGLPFSTPLTSREGRIPQRALPRAERIELRETPFCLKKEALGREETLLLVDDLIVTGATIRAAARALQGLLPRQLYAMAFCR